MLTGNRRQGVGYRDFSIFSSGCKQPNLVQVSAMKLDFNCRSQPRLFKSIHCVPKNRCKGTTFFPFHQTMRRWDLYYFMICEI